MARNGRGRDSKNSNSPSQHANRSHKKSNKRFSNSDSKVKTVNGRTKNSRRDNFSLKLDSSRNIIEGRHAIDEALRWGMKLKTAYIANDAGQRDAKFDQIVQRLRDNDVNIRTVDNKVLDSMSVRGAHQGIVAEIAPYEYADLEDILTEAKSKDNALIVLLDHVTDDGNFGAIVRSAEVVGADGIIIPNARSAKVSAGSASTSVGAVFKMNIAQVANLASAIDRCKEEGLWVFGASEHADDIVWNSNMRGKVVLVMGSEGEGISRRILEKCDVLTKLPQRGEIESLNVAQAACVMCFEWMRQSFGGLS